MFKRILIANRGEIALRLIRCCRTLDIEAVVVYSTADADSLPVKMAHQAVCIGPAPAKDSYLNQEQIIEVAKQTQCEAIHPGYGFLSENAAFARRCEENGIRFIGPSAEIIEKMGDKQAARELMKKHGVPVVPGSDGLVETGEEAEYIADKIGYPVLIKASAGGGGRGMRRAYSKDEIRKAYEEAKAEAISAFGDGSMYIEKLIEHPHHIEIQIIGDRKGHVVHLGERDCSIQRRNQKMLEESPARILTDKQRKKMAQAAIRAAKAAGYYSAGTVEFVVDQKGEFYFIEMNTRIQVEHPVTEAVTGVDLIWEQIRIAAGLDLSVKQDDIEISGHAIECRINAENTNRNFAPSPGKVNFLHLPDGMGVRVETALYQDCEISPFYDSMIAKVIVHGKTRLEAIRRMRTALEELMIEGVDTNIAFLFLLTFNPDFMKGRYDTSFLEQYTDAILEWDRLSQEAADAEEGQYE